MPGQRGLHLRAGRHTRFRVAEAGAQQDQAGRGTRIDKLQVECRLGTEGEGQHVRWLEMFVGDERPEISIDCLDAHLPGSIVRPAVPPQVRNDEAVAVFEGLRYLRPFIAARTRRTVYAEHRRT